MRLHLLVLRLCIFSIAGLPVAASAPAAVSSADRETLAQWSTIDALLKGYYQSVATLAEVKQQGDFGLGTFESLDGEMVVLDGRVYRIDSTGAVREPADDAGTPFAAVTFFDADLSFKVEPGLTLEALQARIDEARPTVNVFYAVRVTGAFSSVKTRSVPRQAQPWPPLAEVVKHQALFQIDDTRGTLVGLWAPAGVKSLNVPGYHFHYLDAERRAGGHVLGLVTGEGVTVEIDVTRGFSVRLPSGAEFDALDFAGDRSAELKAVESDRK